MNIKTKKRLSIVLAVSSLLSLLAVSPSAQESESIYTEIHNQINLENINVSILNSEELVLSVDEDAGLLKKLKAQENKNKLEKYLKKVPEAKSDVIEELKYNSIYAIGYTSAPLTLNKDGNWERIKKEEMTQSPLNFLLSAIFPTVSAASGTSSFGNLTLSSTITGGNWVSSEQNYEYDVVTRAYWTDNSAVSGECYPAGGDDFLLTAVPKSMMIKYDSFSLTNNNGKLNSDYARMNGGNSFIQYRLADDPLGPAQMKEARLSIRAFGSKMKSLRKINSYYVHTWKQMGIQVSESVDAEVGTDLNLGVGLTITPTIQDKSWQLYSYVTFNF